MIDPRIRYVYRTFGCVPFLVPFWDAHETAAVLRALSEKPDVSAVDARTRLSRSLAATLGFGHTVLTASGRYAIQVALSSLGRPGGEVIVPALICRAVATAVLAAGCRPVFADVNEDLTISYESVVRNMSDRTVAVVVAHLSGKPAHDLDRLVALCEEREVVLVDDAAQALGVVHQGRPLGGFGDCGVLSFGLGKPTFSIGGGALVVRDEATRDRCQAIVDACPSEAGRSRLCVAYESARFLFTYRYRKWTLPASLAANAVRWMWPGPRRIRVGPISALEAELQVLQLEKLRTILDRCRGNARSVIACLDDCLAVPQIDPECGYSKCLVRAPAGRVQALARHLWRSGIESEWWYRPLNRQPDFLALGRHCTPRADDAWQDLLAVPVHPALSNADMQRVVASLAEFR